VRLAIAGLHLKLARHFEQDAMGALVAGPLGQLAVMVRLRPTGSILPPHEASNVLIWIRFPSHYLDSTVMR
jgi:hypothetical protein